MTSEQARIQRSVELGRLYMSLGALTVQQGQAEAALHLTAWHLLTPRKLEAAQAVTRPLNSGGIVRLVRNLAKAVPPTPEIGERARKLAGQFGTLADRRNGFIHVLWFDGRIAKVRDALSPDAIDFPEGVAELLPDDVDALSTEFFELTKSINAINRAIEDLDKIA